MTAYFVSTDGNDGADGTEAHPWRTINHAMNSLLEPGDEVIVAPGTYAEHVMMTQSGSPDGQITLRSAVPGEALIRSDGWNAVSVYANHVTIEGFDVSTSGDGNGIFGNGVHHVEVLNNIAHDNPEAGIGFIWSEFVTIDGNLSYGNATSGWFSGISVWEFRNITGDTETPGFRTIIRNNVSRDNVTEAGLHTDGNGIIIDDFQSTQADGYPNYNYPTLIENNLVYSNGGKGVAVHWSDNVTVRNNTAWHNNQDQLNDGTWRGEFSNQDSRGNVWANNIAVADTEANQNNTAIGFYGNNADVIWRNNLTFNGQPGDASMRLDGGNPAPTAQQGNLLGVAPGFADAPTDFRLTSSSPAIESGTGAFGLAWEDLGGGDRTVGTVDIGAYEFGAPRANAAPVAGDDDGFETGFETALTIPVKVLLANDRDPDGDPLGLVSVLGDSRGTVRIDAAGDVVFTPGAGITGDAEFAYRIADGRGGEDTAAVSLAVAGPDQPSPGETNDGGGGVDNTDGVSFWGANATPRNIGDIDVQAVELGTRFSAGAEGEIVAIRFYRGPENHGPHPVTLWSDTGEALAVAMEDGSGTGWREVPLDRPVGITAGEFATVSYHAPEGRYSADNGYFTEPLAQGPLTAPRDAGVYSYGPTGHFPEETYRSSNYWVDPVYAAVEATRRGDEGPERLSGDSEDDVVLAGAGNDLLIGRGADDTLRGQSGNDDLLGGAGADILVGGKGDDAFVFSSLRHSREQTGIDEIRAGDGAVAFEGAGRIGGDIIDLSRIDADSTRKGNQTFEFGSQEAGGLWLVDRDGATVVQGNTDADARIEFELVIQDDGLVAADYAIADFIF